MTSALNSREISVASAAQIGQNQQHRLLQNGAGKFVILSFLIFIKKIFHFFSQAMK